MSEYCTAASAWAWDFFARRHPMDRPDDPTPSYNVHIALLPTDRAWGAEELVDDPLPCSRCGLVLGEDEVPLLLWAQDGRMWGFHFGCVGLNYASSAADDDREGPG